MKTVTDLFKHNPVRTVEEQATLVEAYQAVFNGRGDKTQAEIVLVDILKASGYNAVAEFGVSSETLHQYEGSRRVGAHILQRLSVDVSQLREIGSAVGRENQADAKKGIL